MSFYLCSLKSGFFAYYTFSDFLDKFLNSNGIESVVDDKAGKLSGLGDGMCSACEMAVVWMQNQLRQNQTQERILDYANQVNY